MKIDLIKKIVIFFAVYFTNSFLIAQTNTNAPLQIKSDIIAIDTTSSTNKVYSGESNQAPEDQGFTKLISGNDVFYYKEQSILKIEYRPKNN